MNSIVYPNEAAFACDHTKGLTKREYFAAVALQGLLAAGDRITAVRKAVSIADQLIDALNEREVESER